MEDRDQKIEQLRRYLANDFLKDAIKYISNYMMSLEENPFIREIKNESVNLEGRYNAQSKGKRLGISSEEHLDLERNKIRESISSLISKIQNLTEEDIKPKKSLVNVESIQHNFHQTENTMMNFFTGSFFLLSTSTSIHALINSNVIFLFAGFFGCSVCVFVFLKIRETMTLELQKNLESY